MLNHNAHGEWSVPCC